MSSDLRPGMQFLLVGLGLVAGLAMGALIAFWVLDRTYEAMVTRDTDHSNQIYTSRPVRPASPNTSTVAVYAMRQSGAGVVPSISKDQLMAVKEVRIALPGNEHKNRQAAKELDSLMGNTSHRDTNYESFIVEFWTSPLNYRGYRLIGNHLAIYGLSSQENIRLFRNRGKLFLECVYHQYALTESSEFRALWPLGDSRSITYNPISNEPYIP